MQKTFVLTFDEEVCIDTIISYLESAPFPTVQVESYEEKEKYTKFLEAELEDYKTEMQWRNAEGV